MQIRLRQDGKFNLWKQDFLQADLGSEAVPGQDTRRVLSTPIEPADIRASSWQVIGVFETHAEAQTALNAEKAR